MLYYVHVKQSGSTPEYRRWLHIHAGNAQEAAAEALRQGWEVEKVELAHHSRQVAVNSEGCNKRGHRYERHDLPGGKTEAGTAGTLYGRRIASLLQVRHPALAAVHATVALLIALFVIFARWVWAGHVSEYGHRGPGGEYLYDLSDPGTILFVWLTGFVIAGVVALAYFWVAMQLSKVIIRAFDRKGRRRSRGLCPECAYPIGTSPICTECGVSLR